MDAARKALQGTGWDAPDDLEAAIWQAMYRHGVTTRRPAAFVDAVLRAAARFAPAPVIALPARARVREATGLDDPALTYAGAPVSAPAWWIHDHDQGEL